MAIPDKIKKIFFLTLVLFLSLQAGKVSAIEIIYPPVPGADPPQVFMKEIEKTQAFPFYLQYIYHLLLSLAGIACFYALVSGGITYLVSGLTTSAVQAKTALDKISAGLTGILIILSSYIILHTLDPNLTLLYMGNPESIGGGDIPSYQEPERERDIYVEIPMAGLIENTKEWGEIVKKEADDVWRLTSVSDAENLTIPELSMCLQVLVNECNCALESDCGEYSNPDDAERCSHGCEDDTNTDDGCNAQEDFCENSVDPCDISETATGFPVEDLCTLSAYGDYERNTELLCFGGECLSQNISLPNNLREAISSIQTQLEADIQQAQNEIQELLYAKSKLYKAKLEQEQAESLIRITLNTPINYQSFAGIEDKEIDRIWPYEKPGMPDAGSYAEGEGPLPPVAQRCNGNCLYENPPSCGMCDKGPLPTLVCLGNEYRCCDTDPVITEPCGNQNDSCEDPPPMWQQKTETEEGEKLVCEVNSSLGEVMRDCPEEWYYYAPDGALGNIGDTFKYNGNSYAIPNGGVIVVSGVDWSVGCPE